MALSMLRHSATSSYLKQAGSARIARHQRILFANPNQIRQGVARRALNGRDETAEEALARRLRETQRVEERVQLINNEADLEEALKAAGNNLVVLEVQSEVLCQTGWDEEPEIHWELEAKAAHEAAMLRCSEIKHTFQRIARDCNDATFLTHEVGEEPSPESSALCDRLGIEVLPTVQFWRNGTKLWEHRGAVQMDNDLAEGVLFYEGSAADGVKVTDFVQELTSREQFDQYISQGDHNVLKVVNVALMSAAPCIHVYPAVLALAKNFVGFASFARVMGDFGPGLEGIMREYNVLEVPTFLFFRGGKEVGRHVGSSRADLIGQILQIQQQQGINPPPKPGVSGVPRPARKRASWR